MTTCGAALLLSALAVTVGVSACGGGDDSSGPTESSSSVPTPAPGGATGSGAEGSRKSAAEGSQAFVQPGGDNSIPNFGSEAEDRQRREATRALERFLAARAQGDWATVCGALRGKGRQELNIIARATKGKVTGCVQLMQALQGGIPASSRESHLQGEIVSLRVKGREAFALFHGDNGIDYVIPMEREGAEWKMTQIAPVPYPLDTQEPE